VRRSARAVAVACARARAWAPDQSVNPDNWSLGGQRLHWLELLVQGTLYVGVNG